MEITILCKVVDNFGDIGVAWRMSRQLRMQNPDCKLNLIVDDMHSFSKIDNRINPELKLQSVNDIQIYNWNDEQLCYEEFSYNDGEKLSLILELFQCGRPNWMEKILFEDKLERTVNIIMIDYLTAEQYAEDFHCLKSLTRSAKVQKVNFMPGFTSKTGGLIIDDNWKLLQNRKSDGPVMVFTYERDWTPLTIALKKSGKKVFVAQGRGLESFVKAWGENPNNHLSVLDYLNQQDWDSLMKNSSVLFIRGEESMSRACLSGIPFVWHAYPQSDEYQMVKVNALLDRMKIHFTTEDFDIVRKVWLDFNNPEKEVDPVVMEHNIESFLTNSEKLVPGFRDFALDLRKNHDLCTNLMTFIKKITIME